MRNLTDEQRDALWASAWHWLENWEALQDQSKLREYDPFTSGCPCCEMYLCGDTFGEDCYRCPIKEYTKVALCEGTPWESAYHDYGTNIASQTNSVPEPWIRAAEEEYRFLVSLALGEDPLNLEDNQGE